ncbi:uncharacterized protein [Elaeis guineensis]|uniref:Uncharacterized protein LOC105053428 n=1 Tax=Elaeis guineensis var. tenera TaxID=51953 RepID=A0A6J0PB08_ELAGV|nr:uncharacterized protein LOC105053428 [Elaeis guineensis]XP_010932883.1 uncharacterized protein LOC105053428 [Elaeis guineensis]XP_019701632.1 uncharacterized protein LOC105053428 [Elaeis guineensis]XP_019701636.1 uncharacterized protein LOC105053428 [Elaeis guineensis]
MASAIFSHLQNLWPFSIFKTDDLKVSARLVRKLSIPEKTKQFVFAIREPESDAVVYILAANNLSEQSALDAEYLIKEVQPRVVVAQVDPSALDDIQAEEKCLKSDQLNNVPTSSFGVLKRCLTEKINRKQYENFAGFQILQEIFGVGLYGHFLAAKRAAEDIDSHFLLLESPYENKCIATPPGNVESRKQSSGLHLQMSSLIPGKVTPAVCSNSRKFSLTGALQSEVVRSLASSLDLLIPEATLSTSVSDVGTGECKPSSSYQAPPFAQSVYPLLADLHDIFIDLPSIGKALFSAQKMLTNVNEGEPVDTEIVSNIYAFRIAVEGLRIALNSAARFPIERTENGNSAKLEFSELPSEEKCHVLFAQALRIQARKFGSAVAIVNAGCLAGLRRHWNTSLPQEVADLADELLAFQYEDKRNTDGEMVMENMERKRLLADKPVIAVGAGATAILGASSLSKAIPASTFIKLAAYKIPTSLKFGLVQLQRKAFIGVSKFLGPSKLSGVASAGAKTSTMKFTASAEKIRAVTHSMLASAERTTLLAMRTSFYEIMRMRHTQPFRIGPWATFGCSMAVCTGLLTYGDGIECAAESVPSVPMIASLGRGLQSLHQTSQEVRQTNGPKIQEALQSLMYSLKKIKVSVNKV